MSAVDELNPVARQLVARAVDGLVDEFGDTHSRETVEKVMDDSVRQLHGPEGAQPDVLFVGLGDTGRGQMAAALLTLRSEGRVVAHSAGSTVGVEVDPAIVAVMAELNVDLSEAYSKRRRARRGGSGRPRPRGA